ncbi:uncharacterized protein TNCV_4988091 [Trichonephila clavipes]|nr:uncharacterized protein TNCV_4988091 [Trichonephila clavipes]
MLHKKCIGWHRKRHRGAPIQKSALTIGVTNRFRNMILTVRIVRVQYFVRGGFVGHRSRASSKHLSSHLPVDGARFLWGQKGVALQLQDACVGVGSNKDADHSRCSEK